MGKRTSIAIIVFTILAVVFAACNEEGANAPDESATEWATSMCRGLGQFTESMSTVTLELDSLSTQAGIPVEDKKAQFISLIDRGAQASETLIGTLEATPTPDVEGGQEAVDNFVTQLEKMKAVFEDFSKRFADIDTSKAKAADKEATAAAAEMQEQFLQLQSESTGLTGIAPELDDAINQSPECQEVLGTSPAPATSP